MTTTLRTMSLPLLVVAVLIAIAALRGILGAGLTAWFVMTLGILLIRAPFQAAQEPAETSRMDTREKLLLAAVQVGAFFLPAFWIVFGLLGRANWVQPWGVLVLGAALAWLGLYLFHRSHADLGRHWSVSLELRARHGLVTSGVYAYMRHPMYTAIFLTCIAQALLLPNWIAGLGGLIGFTILYFGRIGREEAMMRDTFGAEWDAYAARTPRLIPGLGGAG